MNWIAGLLAGYLLGSLPTGFLAGKVLKGIDIRQRGSGNTGATNVYRVLGPAPGVVVLLIDIGKGLVPVLLVGRWLGMGSVQIVAGLGAVLGHMFTPFLRFKGGKGVATGAGVFLALAPIACLVGLCVWGALVLTTRYVSVGSVGAALVAPLVLVWQRTVLHHPIPTEVVAFGSLAGLLIVIRHIPNLRRLAAGTENRLGRKKTPPKDGA